ncbi:MAG TPA: TonB family protein [Candidatus Aminicenantes bacterium]|nr:TonB family protein [Candidatus Aminicenantes bacterium]
MSPARAVLPPTFKRAVAVSAALHVALFVLAVVSPSFSRPRGPKGLVQYVNFIGGGGGGGTGGGPGGGGGTVVPKTEPLPPAKKPALRDLTVPSKLKPEPSTALTHPVDKPKTARKAPEKQTAISRPEPAAPTAAEAVNSAAATSGSGFGLRFGTGEGGGGGGTGGGIGGGAGAGAGDPFGIAAFPFQFYLQMISDKITANWFQALVDPGVAGLLQTQVYFRIYRNGAISDVKIDVSSGVESFDLSARRAIAAAAPFAALPNEYNGQYLGITLIFEHAK